jgi:hypothetical protein
MITGYHVVVVWNHNNKLFIYYQDASHNLLDTIQQWHEAMPLKWLILYLEYTFILI